MFLEKVNKFFWYQIAQIIRFWNFQRILPLYDLGRRIIRAVAFLKAVVSPAIQKYFFLFKFELFLFFFTEITLSGGSIFFTDNFSQNNFFFARGKFFFTLWRCNSWDESPANNSLARSGNFLTDFQENDDLTQMVGH